MPHQQNLEGLQIAAVVISAPTNQIEDLQPLAGAILKALKAIEPGSTLLIRQRAPE